MKGNIIAFLESVNHGQTSGLKFCEGIMLFEEALDKQLEPSRPSTGDGRSIQHLGIGGAKSGALLLAVNSFIILVLKTIRNELPPLVFLTTEFIYGNDTVEALQGFEVTLVTGLESLVQIHAKLPTAEPMQRWARIALAANFVQVEPGNGTDWSVDEPQDLAVSHSLDTKTETETEERPEDEPSKSLRSDGHHNVNQAPIDQDSCSLGMFLEQCYGLRTDCVEDEIQPGYKRAFSNWNMFLLSFLVDNEVNQDFRAKLSPSQETSSRLLIEWWLNGIGLDSWTSRAFKALNAAAQTGCLDSDALQAIGIEPMATADKERNHYQQRYIFDSSAPPYHTFMFRLFQMEFLPCHYYKDLATRALIHSRQLAAKLAACQRLSLACSKTLHANTAHLSSVGMDGGGYEGKHAVGSADRPSMATGGESLPLRLDHINDHMEATEHPFPKPLFGKLSQVEKKYLSSEEIRRLKQATFLKSGLRAGASLSPCGWLEKINASEDIPHYLWDVKGRRTVLTKDLSGQIEYTAISHTWGRYRYKDYTKFPKISLDGMKEWSVPQNSKFKVEQLPDILASVPFNTPYIWFDLVCIPQEPIDEQLIFISAQEIGRQAKIFRRAKIAAAWFNDIDTWKAMNASILRLSIHFLQKGDVDDRLQSSQDPPGLHCDRNLELFEDASEANEDPEDFMNRWFSSLWTLQEICLRPDMRLCNKNWEVLAVGEHAELHIGMDDLIALSQGGNFRRNAWETVAEGELQSSQTSKPSAVGRINPQLKAIEQLWELLDLSGLEHLLNASRTTILMLGNQRYCQDNRAEAIMSAIGVTDWFEPCKRGIRDQEAPSQLSEYPLAFVREAASKLGAEFYASSLAEGELLEMLVLSLKPAGTYREGVGSMVPFTSSRLSRTPSFAEGFAGPDHPTVSSWEILPDSSVKVPRAGILSYTGQSRSRDRSLICACVAPDTEEPISLLVKARTKVDLDAWVDSFLPSTRNYAVVLHHGHGVVDGILLKELWSGELIKVGTYHLTRADAYKFFEPKTFGVNWRVL